MLITPENATLILRHGGIIAYPTESVYGFGCDPFNKNAVKRLLKLKQRDSAKGLILIAADWQQVKKLVNLKRLSVDRIEKIFTTWPGPVTWVFPASNKVPTWIKGKHNTVAIRISAHRTVRDICNNFDGPIVSTSANLAGLLPVRTRKDLLKQFIFGIDFIVYGRVGKLNNPTPIYDAITNKVIRACS